MSDARKERFAGFARALFDELYNTEDVYFESLFDDWKERWQEIIARRAYDLVAHTILNTEHSNLDRLSTPEHVERIPDLPEWSKEVESNG